MHKMKTLACTGMILLLFFHLLPGQVPERIEPPNWWTGMKNQSLQILIYGENIGTMEPEIKYKGVKHTRTTRPENKNYLFLDLEIGAKTKPGLIPIQLVNDQGTAISINYPLLERTPGSSQRMGFNTEDVIYLITPDRFANGDDQNDSVEGLAEKVNRADKVGRHGGDIEGIRQHLDYISDLGFTAIWPNPVLENNMPRYSYHGYAITDFYKVDPRMGSNQSYQSFCREASQKGIKVIMDMILNHCGLEHWWMKDPPTKDWINYYEQPYVGTNHKKTIQMDPYAAPGDHEVLTEGWFVRSMPDLNPENSLLGIYLIQNSIWWIEYAGLAGIRMDTYIYPDEDYMKEWTKSIMNEYPNFNVTGEVWHTNPAVVAHWQRGKSNPNGYVSYLPSLFDFPMQNALRQALMSTDEGDSGWSILYEMQAQDFQYADPKQLVVFPDNHDMNRIYTQLEEDLSKFKMAIAFNLTTRGIPQLFYGTELLMTSPKNRDDGIIRSDFPGGWDGDVINAFTGSGLSAKQKEAQEYIRNLLLWRRTASVIHHGKLMQYVPKEGIYVFFRYNENEKIMVILNKNAGPVTLQLDRFRNMLGNSIKGKEIISDKEIDMTDSIHLENPGPLIIEMQTKP